MNPIERFIFSALYNHLVDADDWFPRGICANHQVFVKSDEFFTLDYSFLNLWNIQVVILYITHIFSDGLIAII
jgi:hypothetical protein